MGFGVGRAAELWSYLISKLLAELDPPLVEAVDPPNRALYEHDVLIQCNELAQHRRGQAIGKNHGAWPVARKVPMRLGRIGPPECKRLRLRKQIRHQEVVMRLVPVVRLCKSNEIDRNDACPLVKQLIKRVLTVGARFAPHDRPGVARHFRTVESNTLPVRLHVELLEICGEPGKFLRVGKYRFRVTIEDIAVEDADHRHQHGRILR